MYVLKMSDFTLSSWLWPPLYSNGDDCDVTRNVTSYDHCTYMEPVKTIHIPVVC